MAKRKIRWVGISVHILISVILMAIIVLAWIAKESAMGAQVY